jgi:two-component system, cell cycle response regulator CpdR
MSRQSRSVALVVEDDPIQRDIIALWLEDSGFEVIQCEDAETALLALVKRHPILLVTDINLVGSMSGLDLAQKASRDHPRVRVFVISGKPAPRPLPESVAFFLKPFLPSELIREARACIRLNSNAAR